jgi:hypothetical protein
MNIVYTPKRITRDIESNMAGHQCPKLVRHSVRIRPKYSRSVSSESESGSQGQRKPNAEEGGEGEESEEGE